MGEQDIRHMLYKKWLKSNIILMIISLIFFTYFICKHLPVPILYTSFLFVLMTIGWTLTSLVGMIKTKK